MVGNKQLQIDGKQFALGMATTDYAPDGGIGTSSYNLNPVAVPGTIRATAISTPTGDGATTALILSSCEDPRTGAASGLDRVFVDDDGKLYALTSGAAFNDVATPSSSSGYSDTITDTASFDSAVFITKTTNIVKATVSGASWTLDETWWTGTAGQASLSGTGTRHPLLVYENFLWIADGNKLHNVNEAGTVSADALVLGVNERINALGIDPGSGLMMLGVTTILDSSNAFSSANYIMLFDGYSAYVRRKIPVGGVVTSFTNVGGQVFVGMDNTVNYWNGAGVTFLRRMGADGTGDADMLFKSKVTAFQNTLCVVDGQHILAYGDIMNGQKVWYPLYKNQVDSANLGFIAFSGNVEGSASPSLTSPLILVNFNTTVVRLVSPLNTSTAGTGIFYSPYINFERPVFVRRVRIFTTGITTTAGLGSIGLIDETGTTRTPTVSTFVVTAGQSPRRVFDFDYAGLKVHTAQLKVGIDTQAYGFIRAVIYYDVAE